MARPGCHLERLAKAAPLTRLVLGESRREIIRLTDACCNDYRCRVGPLNSKTPARPFKSTEEEAFLNIQRTADSLMRKLEEVLRPAELSPTQYNVLRILRGAGAEGLRCQQVGERMIKQDPDVTRLLDRLEKRALIERRREETDRRVVTTRITAEGLRILKDLDPAMADFHRQTMAVLGSERTRQLIEAMEVLRT